MDFLSSSYELMVRRKRELLMETASDSFWSFDSSLEPYSTRYFLRRLILFRKIDLVLVRTMRGY